MVGWGSHNPLTPPPSTPLHLIMYKYIYMDSAMVPFWNLRVRSNSPAVSHENKTLEMRL